MTDGARDVMGSAIGKVCKDQNSQSFQDAWAKTVNPRTAGWISASITAMCFLASLAYSIIIGDSFTSLFQTSLAACFVALSCPNPPLHFHFRPDLPAAGHAEPPHQRDPAAVFAGALSAVFAQEPQLAGTLFAAGIGRVSLPSHSSSSLTT